MSAELAAVPSVPTEAEQLDFFDRNTYKVSLFTLTGTQKHATEIDLKPGQHVSGRFYGAVIGATIEGFAKDNEKPTIVYKIAADQVELD